MSEVFCRSCKQHFDEDVIECRLEDMENVGELLEPGDIVPYGECPGCGDFVYVCRD